MTIALYKSKIARLRDAASWVIVLLNKAAMEGNLEWLEENWDQEDSTDFLPLQMTAGIAFYHCAKSQLPYDHVEMLELLVQARVNILESLIHHNKIK